VSQQTADVVEGGARELPLGSLVPEGVVVAAEERLVSVHPASVLPKDRLRHEGGGQAERPRDVFHHEPERRDVVGGLERFRIAEINLVLSVRDLVVGCFYLEPHELQDIDDRAPRIFAEICWREIEI